MKHIEQQELAINSPESYWQEQSELVAWYKKPQTILSKNADSWHDWFADGELNSCYLALDYHIEQGRGDETALSNVSKK